MIIIFVSYLLYLLLSICSTCHFLRPCMVVEWGPWGPLVVEAPCGPLVLVGPMLMGVSPGEEEPRLTGVSPELVGGGEVEPEDTGVDPGVTEEHFSLNLYAPGLKHQTLSTESFSF